LVPLLRAAGLSPTTVGATLLLGASLGGELLNPGAPELRTISDKLGVESGEIVRALAPLLLVQLTLATLAFWFVSARAESRAPPVESDDPSDTPKSGAEARVDPLKALVPLIPLVLLMLFGPPFNLVSVPRE